MYFPASHFSPAKVQKQLNTSCYGVICSGRKGEGVPAAVSHPLLESQPKAARVENQVHSETKDFSDVSVGKRQGTSNRSASVFLLCNAFPNLLHLEDE